MNAPEVYIHFTAGLISGEGEVAVLATEAFLRAYMEDFLVFIGHVLSRLPADV